MTKTQGHSHGDVSISNEAVLHVYLGVAFISGWISSLFLYTLPRMFYWDVLPIKYATDKHISNYFGLLFLIYLFIQTRVAQFHWEKMHSDSHHKHITTTHKTQISSHLPSHTPTYTHAHHSLTHPNIYTSTTTHPLHHTFCLSHTPPTRPPHPHPHTHTHTPTHNALTTGAYLPKEQIQIGSIHFKNIIIANKKIYNYTSKNMIWNRQNIYIYNNDSSKPKRRNCNMFRFAILLLLLLLLFGHINDKNTYLRRNFLRTLSHENNKIYITHNSVMECCYFLQSKISILFCFQSLSIFSCFWNNHYPWHFPRRD